MKLWMLDLMPYQDLPAEFEKQHRSAWVDLPNENFSPELGQQYTVDYLDELEHADTLGFDGVCVNEHHSDAYGLMPSPNLMAATLARNTKKRSPDCLGQQPVPLAASDMGCGRLGHAGHNERWMFGGGMLAAEPATCPTRRGPQK